jgi:hypothetical protein
MTDLIVVPQTNQWQKLKALVLDSVSSRVVRKLDLHESAMVPTVAPCSR